MNVCQNRHWFTRYGDVGHRVPFCVRCRAINPRSILCDCGARRMKGEECLVCDRDELRPCICVEYARRAG
jgi:hypothetical protein